MVEKEKIAQAAKGQKTSKKLLIDIFINTMFIVYVLFIIGLFLLFKIAGHLPRG
ncbi:hypothetical protein CLU81_0509 [Flavobacterium sp. 9]|uniref:hypothetical protein n=1 Tax=Flavobacterium sp. 9 TaxID=2035198 RepID=UPI000C364991|nr:hypothetical protein [Flavobacterium sp. 9]PIF30107.1 hypothetical protein CLU81_0509 [Flavobacterium sp. 9]